MQVEKRNAFRFSSSEDELNAAVAHGKRVLSAALIDFSVKGCFLALENAVDLEVGSEVRVATKKGQFMGIVRRSVLDLTAGQLAVGIEFTQAIEDEFNSKQVGKIFLVDEKIGKTADNNSGIPLMIVLLGFWLVVAFTYSYFFRT